MKMAIEKRCMRTVGKQMSILSSKWTRRRTRGTKGQSVTQGS